MTYLSSGPPVVDPYVISHCPPKDPVLSLGPPVNVPLYIPSADYADLLYTCFMYRLDYLLVGYQYYFHQSIIIIIIYLMN